MIAKKIVDTIGNTPLIPLKREKGQAQIYVKLESKNPGGSIKDRPALFMIMDAIEKGRLKKDSKIVEASSGNMGISIALIASSLGYASLIAMPESMSLERRQLMQALGAELLLTPANLGMQGSVDAIEKLVEEDSSLVYLRQFENPANVKSHRETTGPEILRDLEQVDAFVAGIGTGGSLTGVGLALREVFPQVQLIAVEPKDSPLLSQSKAGPHKIQGIGANFVPKILQKDLITKIITMESEKAFATSRLLAKEYGILCGISSGSNVAAAKEVAKELGEGKTVVTLLCDTGERYLSTDLY